jgi:hypothetical protein
MEELLALMRFNPRVADGASVTDLASAEYVRSCEK